MLAVILVLTNIFVSFFHFSLILVFFYFDVKQHIFKLIFFPLNLAIIYYGTPHNTNVIFVILSGHVIGITCQYRVGPNFALIHRSIDLSFQRKCFLQLHLKIYLKNKNVIKKQFKKQYVYCDLKHIVIWTYNLNVICFTKF